MLKTWSSFENNVMSAVLFLPIVSRILHIFQPCKTQATSSSPSSVTELKVKSAAVFISTTHHLYQALYYFKSNNFFDFITHISEHLWWPPSLKRVKVGERGFSEQILCKAAHSVYLQHNSFKLYSASLSSTSPDIKKIYDQISYIFVSGSPSSV